MGHQRLVALITLPWIAAAIVMLLVTKLRDEEIRWHWGLFGNAAICFSIGCLARTSVMLHDKAQSDQLHASRKEGPVSRDPSQPT